MDAQTLNKLPDEYLETCVYEACDPLEYYFPEENLEPATRRDDDEQLENAKAAIEERMEAFEAEIEDEEEDEEEEELDEALLEEWIARFQDSPEFNELTAEQQEYGEDAPKIFAQFAFQYEWVQVGKWTPYTVDLVCLEWIPGKLSSEPAYFVNFGPVLAQFFGFLHRENILENARALQICTLKIASKIPKEAADSSNWGMAKTMMMGAIKSGIDITDQNQLNEFINNYTAKLNSLPAVSKHISLHLHPNPINPISLLKLAGMRSSKCNTMTAQRKRPSLKRWKAI
ncbi:MAG: hypothetical protein SGI94_09105 [Saprospiraceae bacterium]|nr:hypothetical protein [Saprospiraceae bacterium]